MGHDGVAALDKDLAIAGAPRLVLTHPGGSEGRFMGKEQP